MKRAWMWEWTEHVTDEHVGLVRLVLSQIAAPLAVPLLDEHEVHVGLVRLVLARLRHPWLSLCWTNTR